MSSRITVESHGPVSVITLNDPDRMNALTLELLAELDDAMGRFVDDADSLVAVVTGAGGTAFSAGADLESLIPELAVRGLDVLITDPRERFFSKVEKPIIAAVEGFCLAGGLEVMLGTDIRVAAESATFGLPEVRWGLVPAAGSHVRLPRQIPYAVAMQMLLTGKSLPARRAYELGLVNEVVADGDSLDRALELATTISHNGPLAVRTAKRIAVEALGLESAFEMEARHADGVFRSDDAREGPTAFVERRRPEFTGR